MKTWFRVWAAWWVLGVVAGAFAREELLPLTEARAVSITVPDGFTYQAGVNSRGELAITLTDAKANVSLAVTFAPDAEGEFANARSRRERMHEEFKNYVEGSREKAMQFEELEPKVGGGTYCVFTDDKLLGKPVAEFPEGEYLHLTAGVKAWPGIVATWTLFSNDTNSEPYRAAMKTLRESVHEKPAPLR